ncbi:MAG: GyrI-like domain-containing protein [Bacteroidetes bacterium]|nr:GyrI-like domain-containing protein [Bacteroidota bacterium]
MTTPYEIKDLAPQLTFGVTLHSDKAKFMTLFDVWFPKLWQALTEAGGQPLGGPFARYHKWTDEEVVIELAAPVAAAIAESADFKMGSTPGGKTIVFQHIGHYSGLMQTWADMMEWVAKNGYELASGGWETYVTDPRTEPDSTKWVTEIYQPIK